MSVPLHLRCLIRNAEARVEHLSGVIKASSLDAVEVDLWTRCLDAQDRLDHYQRLATPAFSPSPATADASAPGGAQPGPSLS